ncbi:hypothetical protein CHLRE_09g389171v5 [Chlamydomonas reinhardtii]|uniref:Uncharacterized protein n=1 Tax=Chlamydomonas reinhardtii TaxID=3055 RepID=A0A2K3DDZ5_CHLRE|nr:uncharacterized protein CHLRE_09g389171v5 [Chlamydomonas reinhardtii]PNW78759.1 hypothetical protein CHLRE_09g389171v5 [Chlamydomonas reinhardtii]
MQPPHPQDGALGHTAGAAGAEEPAEGAGGGGEGGSSETFIVPEVAAVLSQANDFWAQNLMPRARAIESEVVALTYEANAVTGRAEAEKQDLVKELGRLSELVLSFQSRIQQFLHFGSYGGQA